MTNSKLIRVDNKLIEVLERTRKEIAEDMKKNLRLDTIEIRGTLASRVMAERLLTDKRPRLINFRARKIKNGKGTIELI